MRAGLVGLAVVFALGACGVDAETGDRPTDDGDAPASTTPSDEDASTSGAPADDTQGSPSGSDASASPPAQVPCDPKQTAALQSALDGAHDAKTSDVVLSVKTACGLRFFASGPSHLTATTLQRIASNTKTYVASIVLELYAEKKLSLTDPVSKWFDKVPGGDAVHVEHLLWHTSGISSYENNLAFQGQVLLKKKWKPSELVDLSFQLPTNFAPGASWEYANVNYTMLGIIAEKVAGKPLVELLHERIFDVIGVKATFSDGDEPLVGTLAKGLGADGSDKTNAIDPSTFWGAGQLVSTPGDLVTWIEQRGSGAFHGHALDAEFGKLIDWKPARAGWKYGPGTIRLDGSVTSGGGPGFGHGGDLPGYHSMAFYFPDKKTTVVMVNDRDAATADEFRKPFFESLKVLFASN